MITSITSNIIKELFESAIVNYAAIAIHLEESLMITKIQAYEYVFAFRKFMWSAFKEGKLMDLNGLMAILLKSLYEFDKN